MTSNSALRVLVGCGIYDMVCDYLGNEWSAAHLEPALRRNVVARRYRGGHAMYTDAEVHLRFKDDVERFIRETLAAGTGR
jgi:carboxypeptidase C (cathepsin A)